MDLLCPVFSMCACVPCSLLLAVLLAAVQAQVVFSSHETKRLMKSPKFLP
jgi:hypothetical protein